MATAQMPAAENIAHALSNVAEVDQPDNPVATGPHDGERTSNGAPESQPVEVIFVAKRSTARAYLDTIPDSSHFMDTSDDALFRATIGPDERTLLTIVSSQKAALGLIASGPPRAILVEIDDRPHSRKRFCVVIRGRVPDMAIYAVGKSSPEGAFAFDGFLSLPLTTEQISQAVDRLDHEGVNAVLSYGPFFLDPATHRAQTPGGTCSLPPKLYALLELLLLRHDEVVSRGEIMESIWETSFMGDTRTLDVHVRLLRQRIEPDPYNPQYLLTERGKGYYLKTQ